MPTSNGSALGGPGIRSRWTSSAKTAEYLKLRRSLRDGRLFDLPPQTVQRYLVAKMTSAYAVWRFNHKIRAMPGGKILRVETFAPAVVHWSNDEWATVQDSTARDVGLGVYTADIPTAALAEGKQLKFTFYWPIAAHWEGADFVVGVGPKVPDRPASGEKSVTGER